MKNKKIEDLEETLENENEEEDLVETKESSEQLESLTLKDFNSYISERSDKEIVYKGLKRREMKKLSSLLFRIPKMGYFAKPTDPKKYKPNSSSNLSDLVVLFQHAKMLNEILNDNPFIEERKEEISKNTLDIVEKSEISSTYFATEEKIEDIEKVVPTLKEKESIIDHRPSIHQMVANFLKK